MGYLDLTRVANVNKRLMSIVGIETAVYWSELSSVLERVRAKKTCDEKGFFKLDRAYIQRETTLTPEKQLECDRILSHFGVLAVDPDSTDTIAVSVQSMVELITEEDTTKLKSAAAGAAKPKRTDKEAKIAGMKATMHTAVKETDPDLKNAYCRWIDSMIDAQCCRFTKAVVELFVAAVRQFSSDKVAQLRVIELATINCYKDASWAINLYHREKRPYIANQINPVTFATHLPEQKPSTGVKSDVVF